MSHRPGNHRDQRRLIDIAPSEMTAAGQVVQLVTQVPIPVSRVQMHHQLAGGNEEYNRGRAQHRKQVPFVTALYRATRHLRLRLRHHPRLLQRLIRDSGVLPEVRPTTPASLPRFLTLCANSKNPGTTVAAPARSLNRAD